MCFALRSTWCRGYNSPIGMRRALLAARAIFCRSAADHGGFARSTLIAASVIPVLAGCSASSPFSDQADKVNPYQTAGAAALPNAAAIPPARQDYADSLPYPKQSLADLFRGSTQAQTQNQTQTQTVPHPPSTFRPALLTTSGPATLWRTPGTRCDRRHHAARQSGSHGLAAVSQTITD